VPATAGYMQLGPAHFLLVLPALACNSTSVYEPGGREFESLRARQLIKGLFRAHRKPVEGYRAHHTNAHLEAQKSALRFPPKYALIVDFLDRISDAVSGAKFIDRPCAWRNGRVVINNDETAARDLWEGIHR
jgi:hypothetical protein